MVDIAVVPLGNHLFRSCEIHILITNIDSGHFMCCKWLIILKFVPNIYTGAFVYAYICSGLMVTMLCLLQELYLFKNNIDDIHPFAFKCLNTLYKLDISNNRLTSAPSLTHVESTLRELILTYYYINHIQGLIFWFVCKYQMHIFRF